MHSAPKARFAVATLAVRVFSHRRQQDAYRPTPLHRPLRISGAGDDAAFFFLGSFYPLTTDFAAWYSGSAIFSLSVIAGLAIYGFYTSLAGQSVFQGKLLEE